MGEAARAPMGAWDIWALGRAMWLNWFIPGGEKKVQQQTHKLFFRYVSHRYELFHVWTHEDPIRV